MMILSGHIVDYNDLKYRSDDECILTGRHKFVSVQSVEKDYDGNYLSYELIRRLHFRSGTAEVGMKRR